MKKIITKETNFQDVKLGDTKQEILQQVAQAVSLGQPLVGTGGLFSGIIKEAMEMALQGEMDAHLNDNSLEEGNNRRNGVSYKTVKTASGAIQIDVPRDRNASFDPQIIKKRQVVINEELDQKIMTLFSLGNSYEQINNFLLDIYGVEVSNAAISAITDRLLPMITEWRNRPLDQVYSVLFLDAMFFKVRENNKVVNKAIYNIMGISKSGHKEILGFYSAETEGASFWLGVLNDLKARGVKDILIVCIDGLKGFPEAINAAFPHTEIQLCVVHQIRNTMKMVTSKDQKAFMVDLKKVYQADTLEMAELSLLQLDELWGKKYPSAIKSWNNNWDKLNSYFKYSNDIRRLIYTTNPIEGFHRQIRKYTKTKGAFAAENALHKLLFAAITRISEKWCQPIPNWAIIYSQLDIYFPDRL